MEALGRSKALRPRLRYISKLSHASQRFFGITFLALASKTGWAGPATY